MHTRDCRIFLLLFVTILTGGTAWTQTSIQCVYDELGRLVAVVDPAEDTAVYQYDAVGTGER
jgi:uncharacterized protein RhaS with RHS repeats